MFKVDLSYIDFGLLYMHGKKKKQKNLNPIDFFF